VRVSRRNDPEATERILKSLPDWFGIEPAIRSYARDAAVLRSYLAETSGQVAGVALVKQHFPASAELHLIAVRRDQHDRGIGRALVEAVERDLVGAGVGLFQVHTVGPSYEDPFYARTRGFYERMGFLPLQEFDRIDWDGPTLVLVKPLSLSRAR
jgi:GNAT superfamily N-acetyltransferase